MGAEPGQIVVGVSPPEDRHNVQGSASLRPGSPAALSVRGLVKWFGSTPAVAGVDLEVAPGSFYGLIGPNGAGKSTTLAMITGLLRPDAGTVQILGMDVWRQPVEVRRRIGVVTETLNLFERLSGAEVLEYSGLLRGMDAATIAQRRGDLLEVMDLGDAAGILVVDYSQGMRKKVALASALIHGPDVLFLDEPLESVDPVSSRTIREVLQRYTASGATVVFSSHVMAAVESMCDHVAVLVAGRVLASGPTRVVRGDAASLDEAFLAMVGSPRLGTGSLDWLNQRASASVTPPSPPPPRLPPPPLPPSPPPTG